MKLNFRVTTVITEAETFASQPEMATVFASVGP
jgi:hypothetical protein